MATDQLSSGYGRPGAPLLSYAFITAVFLALNVAFFWFIFRAGIPLPTISLLDMVLLGMATHKVSWLLAHDVVTSFLRAPFARFTEWIGPGAAVHETARHQGLPFAIGELLTCPWCIGMWVAAIFVFGIILFPSLTRIVAAMFNILMLADFLQILYMRAGRSHAHHAESPGDGTQAEGHETHRQCPHCGSVS